MKVNCLELIRYLHMRYPYAGPIHHCQHLTPPEYADVVLSCTREKGHTGIHIGHLYDSKRAKELGIPGSQAIAGEVWPNESDVS